MPQRAEGIRIPGDPARRPQGPCRARRALVLASLVMAGVGSAAAHGRSVTPGILDDPWGLMTRVAPPGTYSPGRHHLPRIRRPKRPPRAVLADLRSLPALTAWALRHNPRTALAWQEWRAEAAALGVAKSVWLPAVNGVFAAQRSATMVRAPAASVGPANGLYSTLSLDEVLFHFGYRRASVAKARAAFLAARYNVDDAIQQIALAVADRYYDLAEAHQDVAIYRYDVREARRVYTAARRLYHAHLKPITDLDLAKTLWAQARASLSEARGLERVRRGELAQAAGLPVGTPLSVVSLPAPAGPLPYTIRHWLQAALAHNPSLLADLALARETHQAIREAAAQTLPSVSLLGSAGNDEFPHGPDVNSFAVGLQINVPFNINFANTYRIEQQRATYRAARAQTREQAHRVLLAVWQAFYGLQSSMRSYHSATIATISARRALSGIGTQYRIGLANMLDLISAESNLVASRITQLRALTDYYRYRAALFRDSALIPRAAPTLHRPR